MKVVVVHSGGLDSTVLLTKTLLEASDVRALSIDYGQRHIRELLSAKEVCRRLGVQREIANLSAIRRLLGGSSQTDASVPVPHGHYAEESMKSTVVPNRNMILLSVATGWAISLGFDAVAYAAHAGDHTIYPDCRPEFAEALARAVRVADWREISILSPFIGMTKAEIVAVGAHIGAPMDLTWSCYDPGDDDLHCGRCGTCVERREAFQIAQVPDMTRYRR